jgi:hypothetical protein
MVARWRGGRPGVPESGRTNGLCVLSAVVENADRNEGLVDVPIDDAERAALEDRLRVWVERIDRSELQPGKDEGCDRCDLEKFCIHGLERGDRTSAAGDHMSDETKELTPLDEAEKPEAVTEAERTLRRLALRLTETGVGAVALWFLSAIFLDLFVPMSWLGIFLVGLVLFFFFPPTRNARLARDILRQWDEVRVRGMLEAGGATVDPRLEAAEKMGKRIEHHPGATAEMRRLAADLVAALRQTARDERLVELALDAQGKADRGSASGASLRDSLEYLEVRAGNLLGALADLHSAVIRRDAGQVARVLDEATGILAELDALAQVERLLTGDGE